MDIGYYGILGNNLHTGSESMFTRGWNRTIAIASFARCSATKLLSGINVYVVI